MHITHIEIGILIAGGSLVTAMASLGFNAYFRSKKTEKEEDEAKKKTCMLEIKQQTSSMCEANQKKCLDAITKRLEKGRDIMTELQKDLAAIKASQIHNGGFSDLVNDISAIKRELESQRRQTPNPRTNNRKKNMNPKIPNEMNWKDYSTTALQWLSIIGGIVLAIFSGTTDNAQGVATGVGMTISGLAGGKKGSLLEDGVNRITEKLKGTTTMQIMFFCMVLTLFMVALSACSSHPFLKPQSVKTAIDAAEPYITKECKEAELYAGYRLDFSEADKEPKDDPAFIHGFGGILGGCGKYAKISCWVIDDIKIDKQSATEETGKVICKPVELLVHKSWKTMTQKPTSKPQPKEKVIRKGSELTL